MVNLIIRLFQRGLESSNQIAVVVEAHINLSLHCSEAFDYKNFGLLFYSLKYSLVKFLF